VTYLANYQALRLTLLVPGGATAICRLDKLENMFYAVYNDQAAFPWKRQSLSRPSSLPNDLL